VLGRNNHQVERGEGEGRGKDKMYLKSSNSVYSNAKWSQTATTIIIYE
jgi:hypothetical protein